MTKHAIEALFVGLAFLAAVTLATRRDFQCALTALAAAAFIVGLVLTANGS